MGYLGNENTVTGTQNSKRIVLDATPNQTISTVTGGYTIGQLDVYLNGVKLAGTQDFNALDGSTVTFLSAVNSGDEIEYVVFENFDVADAVGTSGNQTIVGNLTVTDLAATQINVSSASTLGVSTATSIVVGSAVTANATGVIATGIGTFGNVVSSGDLTASTNATVTKQTTSEHLNVSGVATVGTALTFADNVKAYWGTGGDLQIYHQGSHSFIEDAGTGSLKVRGSVVELSDTGGDQMLLATENVGVNLYYNGTKKIETTNTGVTVTGNVGASGNVTAVDGTFSGSISVGGTLTYEDVTEVDSAGLSTFRKGINIGSPTAVGATFNPAGDLSVSGIITAGSFSGVVSGIALKADGTDVSAGAAATMINFAGASISNVNSGFTTITIAAGIQTNAQTSTTASPASIDVASYQDHKVTCTGITTITCTGTASEGESHTVRVVNSGIATVGFATYFLWPGGAAPSLPTADGTISLISLTVQRSSGGTGIATQLLSGASLNYS